MTIDGSLSLTDPCADLLVRLVKAFPQRIALDYFPLCGLPRDAAIASPAACAAFDAISTFLVVLAGEALGNGDSYSDTDRTYFWNFGLSLTGYDRACTMGSKGPSETLPAGELLRQFHPHQKTAENSHISPAMRSG